MTTKSGDLPQTLAARVLGARVEARLADSLQCRVDQVILAREPNHTLGRATEAGLEEIAVDLGVAYPCQCVTAEGDDYAKASHAVPRETVALGIAVARPGAGFAPAIHLERFAAPARLALCDDIRLANTGGAAMLTLPASVDQLSEALRTGLVWLRAPRSVRVNLSGRLRPFVSARDASLELVRRGLPDVVQEIDSAHRAPVVIEFCGSSLRHLSVMDRAMFCSMAGHLGAATALFPSDDKTEAFLREQRRSKAHRQLQFEADAQPDAVVDLDLTAVEPSIIDEAGTARLLREYPSKAITQALLGGDSGFSLRDLLVAASLLKGKKVPPGVDFLFAPPSRQILEVLASNDALATLISAGARLIEPDCRAFSGQLYPPPASGLAITNTDPLPSSAQNASLVVSVESLAYAVAFGAVGDPRRFKRPVRVTLPRVMPTDDVLLSRGAAPRGARSSSATRRGRGTIDRAVDENRPDSGYFRIPPSSGGSWRKEASLEVARPRSSYTAPSVVIASRTQDLHWLVEHASSHPHIRAVIAPHVPAALVSILASLSVLALEADASSLARMAKAARLRVAPPRSTRALVHVSIDEDGMLSRAAGSPKASLDADSWDLPCLATGPERDWIRAGRLS